ncbi:helix-turn-helix transcriptional regulator [Solimonas terrae]|uniref:Uncharacterized protein n=1 Tax=Solimonas terrae TaxID=1396819 RepID=A0A6M2BMC2_9GAMM|nr:hypothetical protein [Solimonas terrae]NGY03450.1 hypothetical protein [Solimonas terrae]
MNEIIEGPCRPLAFRAVRRRDVGDILGRGDSTVSLDVARGLLPPPAKYGRNSFWLESEIIEIAEARLRGAADDEIREIVRRQIAERDTPEQRELRIADRQRGIELGKLSAAARKARRIQCAEAIT